MNMIFKMLASPAEYGVLLSSISKGPMQMVVVNRANQTMAGFNVDIGKSIGIWVIK